jgi:formyltetrahydrofolate synthetase
LYSYFSTDTPAELELVQKEARGAGAFDAIICQHWADGGAGAKDLGEAVGRACKEPSNFKFLYDLNVSIGHLAMMGHIMTYYHKLIFTVDINYC